MTCSTCPHFNGWRCRLHDRVALPGDSCADHPQRSWSRFADDCHRELDRIEQTRRLLWWCVAIAAGVAALIAWGFIITLA